MEFVKRHRKALTAVAAVASVAVYRRMKIRKGEDSGQ